MPTAKIRLHKPHENQQRVLGAAQRFKVVAAGRRFGKSELGKNATIHRVIAGQRVWYTALTYANVNDFWLSMLDTLGKLPLADMSKQLREIRLPTGGYLGVRSLQEYDNLRGAGLDYVVIDEAAFVKPDAWVRVLQPMLLERKGGALIMSSPFGRNWFFERFEYANSKQDSEWIGFQFTAYDNPLIDPVELERVKRGIPDRVWQEEYMAQFLEDGAVFRNVLECATADLLERGRDGKRYIIGVDLGKTIDYTVYTVMDPETKSVVHIDRSNQLDYSVQLRRLQALCEIFPPSAVVIETNIEKMYTEQARAMRLPVVEFVTTNASKQVIIEALALAFERQEITIPHDMALMSELRAFTGERRAGGSMVYGAPDGMHDDMVMSLALAWHGAKRPEPLFEVVNIQL